MKLSASSLATFLKSPKSFYWRHIRQLETIGMSVVTYDHDKVAGVLWSAFVDRFYQGMGEEENTRELLQAWGTQSGGWVPPAAQNRLTTALTSWAAGYYQTFDYTDGLRLESELKVEDDRFIGYLDGFNAKTGIIHECKTTSRSKLLSEQLLKVQQSIQVKLYAVLTEAKGVVIEFCWKDSPHSIFRAPMMPITETQRKDWKQELDSLADLIYALGTDEHNFVCNTDCTIISKNYTGSCPYQPLCLGMEGADIAYQTRKHRK